MKPFIVFTTGRAGSTALMDALARHDDIGLPARQVDCRDNELLHPATASGFIPWYQQFSAVPIKNDLQLIQAFFNANRNAGYAGFKSMPNRHPGLQQLIRVPQIQFITLDRRDLASTIASFIVATRKNTWRRDGGQQQHSFTFGQGDRQQALSHLQYVIESRWVLQGIPGAIHLNYEDLCTPEFYDPKLDAYFARHIALIEPKAPTSAQHYVTNWDSFSAFIDENQELVQQNLERRKNRTVRRQT